MDATNSALTSGSCTTAISTIEDTYNSVYTDNNVRMARASAQACAEGLSDFFDFFGNIISNIETLAGSGFWDVLTKLMYSTDGDALDKRILAGQNATDALMAVLKTGTLVADSSKVNGTTNNIGSTLTSDRMPNSNLQMIFVSMANVGNLQNRYGGPTTKYKRGQVLGYSSSNTKGWTSAAKVDLDACTYAASVLNMFDAMSAMSGSLPGTTGTAFGLISKAFLSQMGEACNAGCKGANGTVNGINYGDTGCTFTDDECAGTTSRKCPLALRDRTQCLGAVSDRVSCAAAGIATYVSKDLILGWQSE